MYVIKIATSNGQPCYFAPWEGDPGRTLKIASAVKFVDRSKAEKKIKELQKEYPRTTYTIKEIPNLNDTI